MIQLMAAKFSPSCIIVSAAWFWGTVKPAAPMGQHQNKPSWSNSSSGNPGGLSFGTWPTLRLISIVAVLTTCRIAGSKHQQFEQSRQHVASWSTNNLGAQSNMSHQIPPTWRNAVYEQRPTTTLEGIYQNMEYQCFGKSRQLVALTVVLNHVDAATQQSQMKRRTKTHKAHRQLSLSRYMNC
jgi:hypothetical protein